MFIVLGVCVYMVYVCVVYMVYVYCIGDMCGYYVHETTYAHYVCMCVYVYV